eukprot:GEZU01004521.1.p1 GENE.GEZU01004521.1~~GEZU01004521.1.p1  ORF type:complete len:172 (+),score=39.94 GEZU01004521.1:380-895(+)
MVDNGLTYFCMSDKDFGGRRAFLFLEDIRDRFVSAYGERAKTAPPMAFNTDFSRVLYNQMNYFSTNPKADKISQVRGQLQEVKEIMVDNIEKVLDRGEKIDLLVNKSENLNETATTFKVKSRALKRRMWAQNVKLTLIIIAIVLAILLIIIWLACGFPTFSRCTPKKKPQH